MKNKSKKKVKFWESFQGTIIGEGANKEIKRIKKIYNKHRAKNREA